MIPFPTYAIILHCDTYDPGYLFFDTVYNYQTYNIGAATAAPMLSSKYIRKLKNKKPSARISPEEAIICFPDSCRILLPFESVDKIISLEQYLPIDVINTFVCMVMSDKENDPFYNVFRESGLLQYFPCRPDTFLLLIRAEAVAVLFKRRFYPYIMHIGRRFKYFKGTAIDILLFSYQLRKSVYLQKMLYLFRRTLIIRRHRQRELIQPFHILSPVRSLRPVRYIIVRDAEEAHEIYAVYAFSGIIVQLKVVIYSVIDTDPA